MAVVSESVRTFRTVRLTRWAKTSPGSIRLGLLLGHGVNDIRLHNRNMDGGDYCSNFGLCMDKATSILQ